METIKYKCKTATMTSEFSGELKEGIEIAFTSVKSASERVALMAKLAETHERMILWQAKRDAES